jgi:hypothetical protein
MEAEQKDYEKSLSWQKRSKKLTEHATKMSEVDWPHKQLAKLQGSQVFCIRKTVKMAQSHLKTWQNKIVSENCPRYPVFPRSSQDCHLSQKYLVAATAIVQTTLGTVHGADRWWHHPHKSRFCRHTECRVVMSWQIPSRFQRKA